MAVAATTTPTARTHSVHPAAALAVRHVLAVRHEARVPGVDRVVSRPSGAETARMAAVGSAEQAEPARTPWPAAQTAVPSGPSPADLATITNHVLTAIDHRLVSYRERLGRG
jgi:hypothetical protein